MSTLIDKVCAAVGATISRPADTKAARAAVLAMADWLDTQPAYQCREVARLIREEVAPPVSPEAQVILDWMHATATGTELGDAQALVAALSDAGMLRDQSGVAARLLGPPDESRCPASSWRGKGRKHHPYGPGGFNRCIKGRERHTRHEDEFGNVFETSPTFRVIAHSAVPPTLGDPA